MTVTVKPDAQAEGPRLISIDADVEVYRDRAGRPLRNLLAA